LLRFRNDIFIFTKFPTRRSCWNVQPRTIGDHDAVPSGSVYALMGEEAALAKFGSGTEN
jgi:hypothetical protein